VGEPRLRTLDARMSSIRDDSSDKRGVSRIFEAALSPQLMVQVVKQQKVAALQ